jgi:hypothetical protein
MRKLDNIQGYYGERCLAQGAKELDIGSDWFPNNREPRTWQRRIGKGYDMNLRPYGIPVPTEIHDYGRYFLSHKRTMTNTVDRFRALPKRTLKVLFQPRETRQSRKSLRCLKRNRIKLIHMDRQIIGKDTRENIEIAKRALVRFLRWIKRKLHFPLHRRNRKRTKSEPPRKPRPVGPTHSTYPLILKKEERLDRNSWANAENVEGGQLG